MKIIKEGTTSMINQNIFKIIRVISSMEFLWYLTEELKQKHFDTATLGNDICHAINCISGNTEVAHNITEQKDFLKIQINDKEIDLYPIYIRHSKYGDINMQQSALIQDHIDSACTVNWKDNGVYY